MFEKIVALLSLVPEPHVQTAVALLEGLAKVLHKGQDDDGTILTPEKVAEILAAAKEPWNRIKAKADAEVTGLRSDVSGTIVTGSTVD